MRGLSSGRINSPCGSTNKVCSSPLNQRSLTQHSLPGNLPRPPPASIQSRQAYRHNSVQATIEYTNPEPTIWFTLRHIQNMGRNIALQYWVSITLHIENAVKYAPSGSPFTWQGWRLLSGSTSRPRTGVQLWNPSITGNNRRLIIISCLHWFQPRPMAVIVVSRININ